jgi:hypothetical protein
MKKTGMILATLLVVFTFHQRAIAQEMRWGLSGDVSKYLGEDRDEVKIGYGAAGHVFIPIQKNIWIGGRVSYNYWNLDEDKAIEAWIPEEYREVSWSITGSWEALEVSPALRFSPTMGIESGLGFFTHIGVGVFYVNVETTVTGTYEGDTASGIENYSETDLGASLGGGAMVGLSKHIQLEVFPLYQMIFVSNETIKYLTINIGISF